MRARIGAITVLGYCICLPSLAAPRTIKLAQVDPVANYDVAGNYQLARDRVISVGPFSEAGGFPVFFDSKTRRFGVLYPIGNG